MKFSKPIILLVTLLPTACGQTQRVWRYGQTHPDGFTLDVRTMSEPAAVNFGKANHQKAVYRLSDGREIRLTEDDEYVSPSNLIIYYDPETGKEALLAAAKDYGATILYVYNIIPGIAVSIPDGKNIIEAIAFFEKISGVTSVERDHIYHID